jgi:putative endonuclease
MGWFERVWIDAEQWAVERLYGLSARLGHGSATPEHLVTGLAGERVAYFELRRRGYKIVARRWITSHLKGDVDLIAWDGGSLCFIEVKTRTKRDITPAESAIDEDKRNTLRSMARAFLRTLPESQRATTPVRFDVVSVYLLNGTAELEIFPTAFPWN